MVSMRDPEPVRTPGGLPTVANGTLRTHRRVARRASLPRTMTLSQAPASVKRQRLRRNCRCRRAELCLQQPRRRRRARPATTASRCGGWASLRSAQPTPAFSCRLAQALTGTRICAADRSRGREPAQQGDRPGLLLRCRGDPRYANYPRGLVAAEAAPTASLRDLHGNPTYELRTRRAGM